MNIKKVENGWEYEGIIFAREQDALECKAMDDQKISQIFLGWKKTKYCFEGKWSISLSKQFSNYWFCEIEFSNYNNISLGIELKLKDNQNDHRGIEFNLLFWRYIFSFGIYDSRHKEDY